MQFGPGLIPTFLYYFVSTAVLSTFLLSQAIDLGLYTAVPQQSGILAGLAAGLIGVYFNRTISFTVSFQSQKKFLAQLAPALAQLGYELATDEDGLRVYERSRGKWLAGKVYVQLEEKTATIASRAAVIRQLREAIG